jgi:hypothetical protein
MFSHGYLLPPMSKLWLQQVLHVLVVKWYPVSLLWFFGPIYSWKCRSRVTLNCFSTHWNTTSVQHMFNVRYNQFNLLECCYKLVTNILQIAISVLCRNNIMMWKCFYHIVQVFASTLSGSKNITNCWNFENRRFN